MFGSSVSMLGSRISTIAFPLLVLHLDNSPFTAGLVTCASILPSMFAYIPAGGLVDRWDPWRVMVWSEIIRGLAIAGVFLVLLAGFGRSSIYWLIVFMVVEEIMEIFWLLADRRCMSRLMETDKIASRQASIEFRTHAAVLAGRPIGPFLFTVTPYLPFGADALSFVFSVWALVLIGRLPDGGRKRLASTGKLPGPDAGRLGGEIGEGFKWLIRNRRVLASQLLMAFATLTAQALIMMFLVEADDNRLSTAAIGVVLAASGVGGAIGSMVVGHVPGWIKGSLLGRVKFLRWVRDFWLQIQVSAMGVALSLLAWTGVRFSWCIAVVMLVLGLTGAIGNIEVGTLLVKTLRKNSEEHLLGRIISIGQVMVIGACGLGPFLGGWFIQDFGIRKGVGIFAILALLAVLVLCGARFISARHKTRLDAKDSGPSARGQASPEEPGRDRRLPDRIT